MDPDQLPLRDIHLPPPVAWWPPAPAWWLLALAVIAAVVACAWWWRYRRRAPAASERALLVAEIWRRWHDIQAVHRSAPNNLALVRELSELLRRVAVSLHPRHDVAGLTGEAWLEFLDDVLGGDKFRRGPGRLLISAPYQANDPGDVVACVALCEQWLHAATALA